MKIPIIYAYLYLKVRQKSQVSIIDRQKLKEILRRTILKKGGFPRFMIKYIIEEMKELELLQQINRGSYRILESNCEKKIKSLINYF